MNILFLGSSDFSLPFLESLTKSRHELVAVITTPAKPKGRGLKVLPNPVQEMAEDQGLACFAPPKLKEPGVLESFSDKSVDLMVVASFGKILPPAWLALPRRFPLNVHPSLLPKYRGAAPINWQIIHGESKTGITLFRMEEGVDSGDIVAQKELSIDPKDNAASLSRKLAHEGAHLLMEILDQIESGIVSLVPQNEDEVTYAPKLRKEDGAIDWNRPAAEIVNRVRGLVPWPAASTPFRGEPLKILGARMADVACAEGKPGQILEVSKAGSLRVQAGGGAIFVDRVQPAGKRDMTGYEFTLGRHVAAGDFLQ